MLEAALQAQLATYLQRVTQPVELVATLDGSQASQDLRALLDDVVQAGGGRVSLRVVDDGERSPSFTIGQPGQPARQRFAGLPMGHEFTTLVLSLLQVGGVAPKITDEQAARIRALPGPLAFDTYIGLSCHNCPDVVQALNVMSLLNPAITSTAIDGALFQDEVKALDIMAVPAVFVNGQSFASGRMDVDELLAKIEAQFDTAGAAARSAAQASELSAKAPYDMLIDGAGGLSHDKSDIIIGDLVESTPLGIDGYPQRFGIPDGLPRERVAVKQGWMCCIGPDWMHLSTGIIGANGRYIMVIESREPGSDADARDTITEAVRTMFPHGDI